MNGFWIYFAGKWYLTKFNPVYGDSGELICVSVYAKDITHTKQYESALKEIAWQQSHVIRAPLSRIMGIINVMEQKNLIEEESKIFHAHLLDSAQELDNVIQDIVLKTRVSD